MTKIAPGKAGFLLMKSLYQYDDACLNLDWSDLRIKGFFKSQDLVNPTHPSSDNRLLSMQ
jgi:hypothetical protein